MKKNDLSLLWSLFSFFRGDLLFGSISVYTEVETKRERFIGGKGGGDAVRGQIRWEGTAPAGTVARWPKILQNNFKDM